MENSKIDNLLVKLTLPEQFKSYIPIYFEPLLEIIHQYSIDYQTPVIAINGSQGSGKTTAAIILKAMLEDKYAHRVAVISIDDFYYSKEKRLKLSQSLHPLFITRGVPGTHDVPLALQTINQLQQVRNGETVSIPRFDKATDNRKAEQQWDKIEGPVSIIIFEGWCVGSSAIDKDELIDPINNLEKTEDYLGIWRQTSNQLLATEYQVLFKHINYLLMLKAPSFDIVYEWRLLQEQKLLEQKKQEQKFTHDLSYLPEKLELLNKSQLERFIQHYQRLTEHNLLTIPALANAIIILNDQHQMTHLKMNP